MSKTTIYYSVNNQGDGSAYPFFYDTEALADFDQEHQHEGWGEPCTGSMVINHTGEVKVEDVQSALGYYLDQDRGWEYKAEFIAEFFPDGVPKLRVKCEKGGERYGVYLAKKRIPTKIMLGEYNGGNWSTSELGRLKLEQELNNEKNLTD